MKARTNIRAGNDAALMRCRHEGNRLKQQVKELEMLLQSGSTVQPVQPSKPAYGYPVPPATPAPPAQTTQGCGFVNGVYYPNKSGVCG